MKSLQRAFSSLPASIAATSLFAVLGCAPELAADPDDSDAACAGGKCDDWSRGRETRFAHRWAIDMRKVRSEVPQYADNPRFVAASQDEVGLPDGLYQAACEREQIVSPETGEVLGEGGCFLWGNTMRVDYDHTPHDEEANTIVNIIDEEGNHIDPPGYLNLIALKNADRTEQDEIHTNLRNGDILVYFHPEDSDTTQFRMHHAAMYYDTDEYEGEGENKIALSFGDDGRRYVHHIDNPVSYGPAFNAGVSSVPFHVYRFHPNGAPDVGGRDSEGRYVFRCTQATSQNLCGEDERFTITDEMARLYAYQARNWALVTNGSAPFADFHTMSWRDDGQRQGDSESLDQELDRFVAPIAGRETPPLYCAGLVYTNLNLALNRPMNEHGLLLNWRDFNVEGKTYDFNDNYMQATFPAEALQVDGLPRIGSLLFEPITASGIVDAWLDGYYGAFDQNFATLAAAARVDATARAQLDEMIAQLKVPTAVAESLEPEELGAVMGQAARAAILHGAAGQVSHGFSSLRYQASKATADNDFEASTVATPERVQAYAQAYASGSRDQLTITAIDGELSVTPGGDGTPDLPQMKQIERAAVENRYVPPPMFHWLANRPDSLLSYVGTVVHVDLLTSLTGEQDTGDGQVSEFAEGGPDTSLYSHYEIPDGGRHVQRILEVSAGPAQVGLGSRLATRISAADIDDVRVVLHPAGSFPNVDRFLCDEMAQEGRKDCIGDAPGIAVPISADLNGGDPVWHDVQVELDFFVPVEDGGLGCMVRSDGTRSCPAFDWDTLGPSGEEYVLGDAHGLWTISVIDIGDRSVGATVPACTQCSAGGAHTNQWFIMIRDDR